MPNPLIPQKTQKTTVETAARRIISSAHESIVKTAAVANDIVSNDQLTSRLMGLDKYKRISDRITNAVNSCHTGVVNIVTGQDGVNVELVEAILKTALPSNRVWKGNYGFNAQLDDRLIDS